VRREVALRPGAATKARRWMNRRLPRLVVLAVRDRRGSDVAREEGDNGEEVGRWKTLRRRVGLHSGWGWSSGTAPVRGGESRSRAERKRG
jgi:hypothetical protein